MPERLGSNSRGKEIVPDEGCVCGEAARGEAGTAGEARGRSGLRGGAVTAGGRRGWAKAQARVWAGNSCVPEVSSQGSLTAVLFSVLSPSSSRLVKTQIAGPTSRGSGSAGVWWGQRICISYKSPDLLMLLVLGLHFENHRISQRPAKYKALYQVYMGPNRKMALGLRDLSLSNCEASTAMLQERYKYNVMRIPRGQITPKWRRRKKTFENPRRSWYSWWVAGMKRTWTFGEVGGG